MTLLVLRIFLPILLAAVLMVAAWVIFGPPSLVLVPLMVLLIYPAVARVRRRRGQMILTHVQQIVTLNLPLASMLEAAAAADRSPLATRLRDVAHELSGGSSLAHALDHAAPEVPPDAVAMVHAGERTGQLPAMLTWLLTPRRAQDADANAAEVDVLLPLLEFIVLCGVVGGLGYFIAPRYGDLLSHMGVEPPRLTRMLIESVAPASPAIGVAAVVAWGVMLVFIVGAVAWPGRAGALLRHPLETFASVVPGPRRLLGWRGLADAMFVMSGALRSGLAMHEAAREAAATATPGVRRVLRRWAALLESGHGASESARRAGMPPLAVGLIGGSAGCDLPEVLAFLARYYRGRFSRAMALVRGAVLPALTLVLGVLVALTVLALMLPLVAIIDAGAGAAGGLP